MYSSNSTKPDSSGGASSKKSKDVGGGDAHVMFQPKRYTRLILCNFSLTVFESGGRIPSNPTPVRRHCLRKIKFKVPEPGKHNLRNINKIVSKLAQIINGLTLTKWQMATGSETLRDQVSTKSFLIQHRNLKQKSGKVYLWSFFIPFSFCCFKIIGCWL